MKLDITRAWKDETYRESLSNEQLSTLPSNPVGELSDAELDMVSGGWGSGYGCGSGCGFGGGCCGYTNVYNHTASFAVLCELNVFSLSVISNIAILGTVAQPCIKG